MPFDKKPAPDIPAVTAPDGVGSIMLSNTGPARHKLKRTDWQPIPHRYFSVLSLHLAGKKAIEIAKLLGYKQQTVYKILQDPRTIQARQFLLEQTQDEFEALFDKVVDACRDGLDDIDPAIRLTAGKLWLKAHGKYQRAPEEGSQGKGQLNLTAEDVVINILNQGQQSVGSK